jgi:hypothetical protein
MIDSDSQRSPRLAARGVLCYCIIELPSVVVVTHKQTNSCGGRWSRDDASCAVRPQRDTFRGGGSDGGSRDGRRRALRTPVAAAWRKEGLIGSQGRK